MIAALFAIALVAAAVALVAAWVWAARRFDFPWWATLISGLILAPFAAGLIFLAGLLTLF